MHPVRDQFHRCCQQLWVFPSFTSRCVFSFLRLECHHGASIWKEETQVLRGVTSLGYLATRIELHRLIPQRLGECAQKLRSLSRCISRIDSTRVSIELEIQALLLRTFSRLTFAGPAPKFKSTRELINLNTAVASKLKSLVRTDYAPSSKIQESLSFFTRSLAIRITSPTALSSSFNLQHAPSPHQAFHRRTSSPLVPLRPSRLLHTQHTLHLLHLILPRPPIHKRHIPQPPTPPLIYSI